MFAYANGHIPQEFLGPITVAADGRRVYMRKDAARAFLAMNAESEKRFGITIRAMGSLSAYRNYAGQVYLWNNVPHARDPNWVARPGTSNHGLGLAIDLANRRMRWVIDQIGAKYGFSKSWSDAPLEWWHIKWKAGDYAAVDAYWKRASKEPVIRKGSRGRAVRRLQVLLRQANDPRGGGYLPAKWTAHEKYTLYVRKAVRQFQRDHGLTDDGVVGPKTWQSLRRSAANRRKK